MRLILLRHAQSTWNKLGRWQGQANPELSIKGQREAEEAARNFAQAGTIHITGIYTSPLARARQTAEIIAAQTGMDRLIVESGLVERDLGAWTGLTVKDLRIKWPGYLENNRWPDDAETTEQLQQRSLEALERIVNLQPEASLPETSPSEASPAVASAKPVSRQPVPQQPVSQHMLIITHAGVIAAIESHFGLPWQRTRNLSGRVIIAKGGELSCGETIHSLSRVSGE